MAALWPSPHPNTAPCLAPFNPPCVQRISLSVRSLQMVAARVRAEVAEPLQQIATRTQQLRNLQVRSVPCSWPGSDRRTLPVLAAEGLVWHDRQHGWQVAGHRSPTAPNRCTLARRPSRDCRPPSWRSLTSRPLHLPAKQATVDLLRHVIHRLKLVQRLRQQMSAADAAGASKSGTGRHSRLVQELAGSLRTSLLSLRCWVLPRFCPTMPAAAAAARFL